MNEKSVFATEMENDEFLSVSDELWAYGNLKERLEEVTNIFDSDADEKERHDAAWRLISDIYHDLEIVNMTRQAQFDLSKEDLAEYHRQKHHSYKKVGKKMKKVKRLQEWINGRYEKNRRCANKYSLPDLPGIVYQRLNERDLLDFSMQEEKAKRRELTNPNSAYRKIDRIAEELHVATDSVYRLFGRDVKEGDQKYLILLKAKPNRDNNFLIKRRKRSGVIHYIFGQSGFDEEGRKKHGHIAIDVSDKNKKKVVYVRLPTDKKALKFLERLLKTLASKEKPLEN